MDCKNCKKEKEIRWLRRFIRFLMFTAGFYWGKTITPEIAEFFRRIFQE